MAGRHRKPPSKGGQGRHRRPQQRRRLVAPALGSVLLLGAGGIAAAAAITGGGGSGVQPLQRPTATTSPIVTTPPVPSTPSTSPPAASPTPSAVPTPDRPAPVLAVKVTGRVSWIEVTRPGGRVLYSGLLRHGRAVVVHRGAAHLVIGDAGAVRLSRGARVADPAGRPGEVRVIDVG
jgi:hypothetical protein